MSCLLAEPGPARVQPFFDKRASPAPAGNCSCECPQPIMRHEPASALLRPLSHPPPFARPRAGRVAESPAARGASAEQARHLQRLGSFKRQHIRTGSMRNVLRVIFRALSGLGPLHADTSLWVWCDYSLARFSLRTGFTVRSSAKLQIREALLRRKEPGECAA